MYQILGWRGLITIAGGLVGLILLGILLLDWPEAASWDLFEHLGKAISAASLIILIVGQWLWRPIWRWIPSLNRLVYPDLNGTWQAKAGSNWSIIKAMRDAAVGGDEGGGGFEVTRDLLNASKNESYTLTLRIRASWFSMTMDMETPTAYSESETLFIVPQRSQRGGHHQFLYIYKNETATPEPGDVPCHDGAAIVTIKPVPDSDGKNPRITLTLEGRYWTNRAWTQGLNTAGTLSAIRIDRDPNAPTPPD